MNKIFNWIKKNKLMSVLILLCLVYAFFMIVEPYYQSRKLSEVVGVWHHWQSLNTGVIALVSSIVFYYTTKYNEEKQRIRNFRAALAFLPDALSELSTYLTLSAGLFKKTWCNFDSSNDELNEELFKPDLPDNYRHTFKQCITFSDVNFSEHLVLILRDLQVHDSRLGSVVLEKRDGKRSRSSVQYSIEAYMSYLSELQILINKAFEPARNEKPFGVVILKPEDYSNAYHMLDIKVEEFGSLVDLRNNQISSVS